MALHVSNSLVNVEGAPLQAYFLAQEEREGTKKAGGEWQIVEGGKC